MRNGSGGVGVGWGGLFSSSPTVLQHTLSMQFLKRSTPGGHISCVGEKSRKNIYNTPPPSLSPIHVIPTILFNIITSFLLSNYTG